MKKKRYQIKRILLKAPLKQCIKNNFQRKRKNYDKEVIKEVYNSLSSGKGEIINCSNKSLNQIYSDIKNRFLK